MSRDVSQSRLIDRLTAYLNYCNLPIKLNPGGICNGLAILHAKYVLEGRGAEFIEMLQYISGKKIGGAEADASINEFVAQIVLSFDPGKYYQELNQIRSYEVQKIDGKPLKSDFHLSLVTTQDNWSQIFETINLQVNEVIIVHGMDHTISITKRNNRYVVYDPNYEKAEKTFSTSDEMVRELHTNCFEYNSKELGLVINVISHPNHTPRVTLPNAKSIYEDYLTSSNVGIKAKIADKEISTIELAASINDTNLMDHLLKLDTNQTNIYNAAIMAATDNNPDVLKQLLSQLSTDKLTEYLITILFITLKNGRQEAFDAFLQIPVAKQCYDFLKNNNKTAHLLINFAARGGNADLLQRVIDDYKNNSNLDNPLTDKAIVSSILKENNNKKNAIASAITSTNPECLRKLLNILEMAGTLLEDEKKLQYLKLAIKQNQPLMVDVLLEITPRDVVQKLTISLLTIKKTDLGLLKKLQSSGMEFSDHGQAVMAQKEHQTIGLFLAIGIALIAFTEFCKEILFNHEGVTFDNNKNTFFKPTQPDTPAENAPTVTIPIKVN